MEAFRGQDGKYHILYKITNLLNNRFYIGIHSTRILNDGYMGSGKRIQLEIKKYGVSNFSVDHLLFFENREALFLEEAKIVNNEMLSNPLNLNICKGGNGNWSVVNSNPELSFNCKSKGGKIRAANLTFEDRSKMSKKAHITKMNNGFKYDLSHLVNYWTGNSHSDETREKMSLSHKGKHEGEKNVHYGTMWIYNLETLESIRIKRDEIIPDGWNKGRKICKESPGVE